MDIVEAAIFFLILVIVIAWLMRAAVRSLSRLGSTPVRDLYSGRIVDPTAPPSPRELEVFKTILRRRGLPGWGVAGLVYLVATITFAAILPLIVEDLPARGVGEAAIPLGFLAGLMTYATRLMLCRCPRCNRRLFSWLVLFLLVKRSKLGTGKGGSPLFRDCPHCGTLFVAPDSLGAKGESLVR